MQAALAKYKEHVERNKLKYNLTDIVRTVTNASGELFNTATPELTQHLTFFQALASFPATPPQLSRPRSVFAEQSDG